jgi:glycerate 2-kinase
VSIEQLRAHGDTASRAVALDIAQRVLLQLNIEDAISNTVACDGETLRIGTMRWELGRRRLFVIGAGKAANAMARAVERQLGGRIAEGLVIVKQPEEADKELRRIELVVGGHPIPNEAGLRGAKRILELAGNARQGDLFVGLISGGSSALMPCPVHEVTLEDEAEMTRLLLYSGARIVEINAIRRHISRINGGRLAQAVSARGAEMVNLIIHDVVGDGTRPDLVHPIQYYGTPVGADPTTLREACRVLDMYSLRQVAPQSVVNHLTRATSAKETPKSLNSCDGIHNFVLQTPESAVMLAQAASKDVGVGCLVLTSALQGESSAAGGFLGCVAAEIAARHRPVVPPCIVVAGGETTTTIRGGEAGLGGPSQELSLGFGLEVAGLRSCSIVAIDTDGTDGPTEFAGGVTDSATVARAEALGIDIRTCLGRHESSMALRALGDIVITGNTGTNVCDLNVVSIV